MPRTPTVPAIGTSIGRGTRIGRVPVAATTASTTPSPTENQSIEWSLAAHLEPYAPVSGSSCLPPPASGPPLLPCSHCRIPSAVCRTPFLVTPTPYGRPMYASVTSVAMVGVEAREVLVEARVGRTARTGDSIVGLPDTAVREARHRVTAAIVSSGYHNPGKFTVNLAPAEIPKNGTTYDLPIALAILAASGQIPSVLDSSVVLGELGLDGSVLGSRGGVAAAIVAHRLHKRCVVATSAASQAALVEGAPVVPVDSLLGAVAALRGTGTAASVAPASDRLPDWPDLAAVRGQAVGRRALEVASAGGHHLLMSGPPGSGKTLLASAAPGLLPPLTAGEARVVAQIYSAAGLDRESWSAPPYRSPHHSATSAAVLGGGSGMPVPGEVSLAHAGILFLDELGEYPANLLDGLRQPLESGSVTIARKGISLTFPARFQLIGATNPCPCGNLGSRAAACVCSAAQVERYRRRLSGPLIDRFDLNVYLDRVDPDELLADEGESSDAVSDRVRRVRTLQRARGFLAGDASRHQLDGLSWTDEAAQMLRTSLDAGRLTARGYDRVRRVAVSIADLAESEAIGGEAVAEALALRTRR